MAVQYDVVLVGARCCPRYLRVALHQLRKDEISDASPQRARDDMSGTRFNTGRKKDPTKASAKNLMDSFLTF